MELAAGVIFLTLAGLAGAWAWRYWMLRTWRTVALLATSGSAALVLIMVFPWPLGLLAGSSVVGLSIWVVAVGHRMLWAVSEADQKYVKSLQMADENAAAVLSRTSKSDPADVSWTVDRILERLEALPRMEHWDDVRRLKVEELRLARGVVSGTSVDPEADLTRLSEVRDEARRQFRVVTRSRARFWR